ncbi:polysaccharide pyruvyl transferase family protein [Ureibacillus chungkukjangi]|uniref:polysaccharide pyruvyl transferase family protein n=1 Tax=Ureibacillus chungkukjangi TaxID=1202712 RepID=UPI003850353C
MGKYILITGGELFNKGAQSMTFITVDEIKKRYPEKEIVLLSTEDFKRNSENKNKYSFEILPLNLNITLSLLGGIYSLISRVKNKNSKIHDNSVLRLNQIINETEMIIDISGYALSSQWGVRGSIAYLFRIKLAEKFGVKIYLMPQSFGPFLYSTSLLNKIMYRLLKRYLKYPNKVFARENEGYDILKNTLKLNNVEKSHDIVLLNKGIETSNIYMSNYNIKEVKHAKDVAIVPNMRNFEHGNSEQIMEMYDNLINLLNTNGKTVYLVRHSYEDLVACELIKKRNINNDKVILLSDDMSSIEFDELVKKFDFLIASRYHSIVHAYKNGVPCIAMGWATKYHELLEEFNQQSYIFDVRNNIDQRKLLNTVEQMLTNNKDESLTIIKRLKKIQNYDIFNELT